MNSRWTAARHPGGVRRFRHGHDPWAM